MKPRLLFVARFDSGECWRVRTHPYQQAHAFWRYYHEPMQAMFDRIAMALPYLR